MLRPLRLVVLCAGVAGVVSFAHAHHGFGTFDLQKDLTITGVVTKIDFVNPHSWLYLAAVDENGQEANWRCEMRGATVLRRSGWSPEMFANGERVTISGSPDRNDERSCYVSTITWANGTSMNRYGQREKTEPVARPERELRLASGELNISGDWAPEQMVMTDPRGREERWFRSAPRMSSSPAKCRKAPRRSRAPATQRRKRRVPRRALAPSSSPKPAKRQRRATTRARPKTIRACVARRRASSSTGRSTARSTGSRKTATRSRCSTANMGFTRTIHMNVAEHPATSSRAAAVIRSAAGRTTSDRRHDRFLTRVY